jgi:hypothetical protein
VCVTGTTRVRSRVKGNVPARFCSRGGGSDPLVYCNRTRQQPRAAQHGALGGLGFMREQLERLRESVIHEVVPVLPD